MLRHKISFEDSIDDSINLEQMQTNLYLLVEAMRDIITSDGGTPEVRGVMCSALSMLNQVEHMIAIAKEQIEDTCQKLLCGKTAVSVDNAIVVIEDRQIINEGGEIGIIDQEEAYLEEQDEYEGGEQWNGQ